MLSNLLKLKTITYAKQYIYRTPKKSRALVFQRHISRLRNRRVEELEREAFNDKLNPESQIKFLKELNRSDPHGVVKIVESGEMGVIDEKITAEYIKALSRTGKMTQTNSNKVITFLKQVENGGNAGGHNGGYMGRSGGHYGRRNGGGGGSTIGMSQDSPLIVQFAERSFKDKVKGALPNIILIGGLIYILSSMMPSAGKNGPGGGGGPMSILSGSKTFSPEMSNRTFDDVQGCEEAKDQLVEIVEYLKDPTKFTRLGGKLPKGVLLAGPPGTGKTLLARAIAGEAGVPFFYASGAEFDEMFVGVGARRIRDLFKSANAQGPAIIFLDEIDAVGRKRSGQSQQHNAMTLNQLLVELDGFKENKGVIVIAATNFADSLDPALVRPGRFDRQIAVPLPDIRDRTKIIEHYLTTITADPKIEAGVLARGTPGFSGADLANVCNLAAIRASVLGKEWVDMSEIEYAKDKILMGDERKSAFISKETQECTAYHESGHAIVAIHTKGAHPVHKATIVPRGRALGMVMQLPEGDQTSVTKEQLLAKMDVCMGGRVAEELIFGADKVTSGASSDFQQATSIARNMVMAYGMVEEIGIMRYSDNDLKELAPDTRKLIDDQIKRLLNESYARAKKCLLRHSKEHHKLAKALIDYESLTGDEIRDYLNGKPIEQLTREEKAKKSVSDLKSRLKEKQEKLKALLEASESNNDKTIEGNTQVAAKRGGDQI
jgi:ATP-dependent metalloprotease